MLIIRSNPMLGVLRTQDLYGFFFVCINRDLGAFFDLSVLAFFQETQRPEKYHESDGRSGLIRTFLAFCGTDSQLLFIDGFGGLDANVQLTAAAEKTALFRVRHYAFQDRALRNNDLAI